VQIEDSVNTWNLQQRMAHYKIPGLSIAVVHNGKIEWARGYGVMDTATQKPVTVQTLFQAASISKSLNGVGVLKLVQDKKIDLHTDINTYLHTWKFPYDSLCWTTTDATCIQLTSKNFSSKMLFTFHYPLLTDTPFCHTYFLL